MRRAQWPNKRHKPEEVGFKEDLYAATGADGPRVLEAACWAHVRCKSYDVHHSNGSPFDISRLVTFTEIRQYVLFDEGALISTGAK